MINIVVISGIVASVPKKEKVRKDAWGTTFYLCTYDNFSTVGTSEQHLNIFKCISKGDAISEYVQNKCKKGNIVLVRGALHTAKYLKKNKDGSVTEQNVTEITTFAIQIIKRSIYYNFRNLPDIEKRFLNIYQQESRKQRGFIEMSELVDILKENQQYTGYMYTDKEDRIQLPIDCDEEEEEEEYEDYGTEEPPPDSI